MTAQRTRLNDLYGALDYCAVREWITRTGKCFITGTYDERIWDAIAAKHDLCPAGMFHAFSPQEAVFDAVRSAALGTRAYAYDGETMIAMIEAFEQKGMAA